MMSEKKDYVFTIVAIRFQHFLADSTVQWQNMIDGES